MNEKGYRTWSVSTQRDEGFMLNVHRCDRWRDLVLAPIDFFHTLTGARWFYTNWNQDLLNKVANPVGEPLVRLPLTYEQVKVLSGNEFDWSSNADLVEEDE